MKIVVRVELITDWGEEHRVEVGRIDRPSQTLEPEAVGLTLEDGKRLLHSLQQSVIRAQAEEIHELSRICRGCHRRTPIKDYRHRKIDTVFGTVSFRSPRIITCECDPPFFLCMPLRPLRPIRPRACDAGAAGPPGTSGGTNVLSTGGGDDAGVSSGRRQGEPRDDPQSDVARWGEDRQDRRATNPGSDEPHEHGLDDGHRRRLRSREKSRRKRQLRTARRAIEGLRREALRFRLGARGSRIDGRSNQYVGNDAVRCLATTAHGHHGWRKQLAEHLSRARRLRSCRPRNRWNTTRAGTRVGRRRKSRPASAGFAGSQRRSSRATVTKNATRRASALPRTDTRATCRR